MTFLCLFVHSARLVGVAGSGVMAGYCIAASHGGIPSLYAGDLSAKQLANSWKQLYTRGAKFAVSTVTVSTLAYFFSAYNPRYLPRSFTILGLSRSAHLALAGIVLFSALPYTRIVMVPGIRKLQAISNSLNAEDSTRQPSPEDERKVREGVQAWATANDFRAAIFSVAFALGLTALV
ncbi:hypothetical protein FRB99_007451 [Tulasnella sp. 403]|nr:hypothetical protein FRB99_007451 [Tulasnella sp. 403]